MRISDWLLEAKNRLEAAGIESARLESQVLAAHGLGQERAWILAHPEAELNSDTLEPLLARREGREPLSYILGRREFFGRTFHVSPAVLIPRQETETLVESVLETLFPAARVLDLGTGSGCIGITIALERPEAEVWMSDVSDEALAVARANAQSLGASVTLVESDCFEALGGLQFDRIVSNPPYVATGAKLEPEVGVWEPQAALFAGHDGLEFYRRLSSEAAGYLSENGLLIIEVGDDMNEAVASVFAQGGWRLLRALKDLSGWDRVLVWSR